MADELRIPDEHWLRELSNETRALREEAGSGNIGDQERGVVRHGDVVVIVVGPGVPIGAGGYGSSGPSGSGGSGGSPLVYPALRLQRNPEATTLADKWTYAGEMVYAEELNENPLQNGVLYKGTVIDQYQAQALVEVNLGGGDGGVSGGVCRLPASATQLAEESNPDDPVAGLAAWTHDDELQIQLSDECCYVSFVDRFCADDGTHMQCKRRTIYFSNKVKEATGPTEDNCPPADWMADSLKKCGGMADF